MKGYLGIDTGSTSIKFALINENKEIVTTLYLENIGVIQTLQQGLSQLANSYPEFEVKGVAVTGSGRTFTSFLVGADIVQTEIIAHAIGCLQFIPEVQTIFEIGGEDSKLILLREGVVVDFAMNQLCAAGTGAFIGDIAYRLGVKIEEVGPLTLNSNVALNLPGKCTVFCRSSCVSKYNQGSRKEDVLWGACKALIRNYFALLTKGKSLLPPFVFQGGTTKNQGIVKALEEELEHEVIIPPYADCMGAVGCAFLVASQKPEKTRFKGFKIVETNFSTREFICSTCENNCEIIQIREENKLIGHLGSRCGRW
jgi:predicted CoA-substrate-specific enzyme activase